MLASTPPPPYYVVIFSNILTEDDDGYAEMAERMELLASNEPGFLGIEHARESIGITLSYWDNEESIAKWKANVEHLQAQKLGKARWYKRFITRVARVERDYSFER